VGKYSKGEAVSSQILILMGGMFILQLIFMFIGAAIASACKNPKTATSVSTAVLLITYLLSMAIDLSGKIDYFKYLTPFKYFEAKNLMFGGGFQLNFVIISLVLILAMIKITYVFYDKRDLSI
jgi:ABC-2 type transport system permease protein